MYQWLDLNLQHNPFAFLAWGTLFDVVNLDFQIFYHSRASILANEQLELKYKIEEIIHFDQILLPKEEII